MIVPLLGAIVPNRRTDKRAEGASWGLADALIEQHKACCWGRMMTSSALDNALFRGFESLGMLQEMTGQQRGRAYAFERYLRLFVS